MSRSRKRKRPVQLQSWLTDDEAALARRKAAEVGVSVSELIRMSLFRYRPPPTKADQKAIGQLLGAIQTLHSEWNKIGSNINQIAKEVNIGRTPRQASFMSEWEELRDTVNRDFLDFRNQLAPALGERNLKPKG